MKMLKIFSTSCIVVVLAAGAVARAGDVQIDLDGRKAYLHLPETLPADGPKALVVVLHGGLGNAERIVDKGAEHGLNLDALADQGGFIVAYLDGTPIGKLLPDKFLGWNAGGGCCGQPFAQDIDDVHYVAAAAAELAKRYGFGPEQVFGLGHSNGGMMLQRVVCEAGVFGAIVAVAGPLNLESATCPGARGRRILAIHGQQDENVPVAGGVGTKGISKVSYQPEAHSQALMEAAGANYQLQLVPGADHSLETIDAALTKSEHKTVAEKAVAFLFGF